MSVAGPAGPGDAHTFAYISLNIRFFGLGRIPLNAESSHNHFPVRQSKLGRKTAELWANEVEKRESKLPIFLKNQGQNVKFLCESGLIWDKIDHCCCLCILITSTITNSHFWFPSIGSLPSFFSLTPLLFPPREAILIKSWNSAMSLWPGNCLD